MARPAYAKISHTDLERLGDLGQKCPRLGQSVRDSGHQPGKKSPPHLEEYKTEEIFF